MAATLFNDLIQLDTASLRWTVLSNLSSSSAPSPRFAGGFAAASNGRLYVFAGMDAAGSSQIDQ